jgi:hypothetical protein
MGKVMIPIFHFLNWLSCAFAFFVFKKLYRKYQESKEENLGFFLGVFLTLGVFFGLVAIPGTIINHPWWVQYFYALSWVPLSFAPFFMLWVICNLWKIFWLKTPTFFLAVILAMAAIVFNALYFESANLVEYGKFFHWGEKTPYLLQIINGTMIMLITLIDSTFFFIEGVKVKEKWLKKRAFLIGGGIGILLVAAFVNYVLSVYLFVIGIPIFRGPLTILSSVLGLLGLYLCYRGIKLKPSP